MPNTKVRVKLTFNHAAVKEILPMGYETVLIPILSTKPKEIVRQQIDKNHKVISHAVVAPAGTFEGYKFLGANGRIYDDKVIINWIGNVPADKIFDKI